MKANGYSVWASALSQQHLRKKQINFSVIVKLFAESQWKLCNAFFEINWIEIKFVLMSSLSTLLAL